MRLRALLTGTACLLTSYAVLAQCPADKTGGGCGARAATCSAAVCGQNQAAELTTNALASLLGSGKKVTLLDARSGKWDDGRRIPGAKALAANATTAQVAAAAGLDKDAPIVTYCTNLKCGASKRLATALRTLGYTNVREYPEGIDGWQEAGKTVSKAR